MTGLVVESQFITITFILFLSIDPVSAKDPVSKGGKNGAPAPRIFSSGPHGVVSITGDLLHPSPAQRSKCTKTRRPQLAVSSMPAAGQATCYLGKDKARLGTRSWYHSLKLKFLQ